MKNNLFDLIPNLCKLKNENKTFPINFYMYIINLTYKNNEYTP